MKREDFMKLKEENNRKEELVAKEALKNDGSEAENEDRPSYPSMNEKGLDEKPLICAIVAGAAYDYTLYGRLLDIYAKKGDCHAKTYGKAKKLFSEAKNFFSSEWFREITLDKISGESIVEICEKARTTSLPSVDHDSLGRHAVGYFVKGEVNNEEVIVNIVQAAADRAERLVMTMLSQTSKSSTRTIN